MPASEYLDFFGQIYQVDAQRRKRRIAELLEHFGLHQAHAQKVGQYSKGMRQKLALARALLHEPPVLLLDEPTSAMDPESARLVRDAIKDLRSAERAIVICTHNLAEAEELADKIAIIRRGKIIVQGSPAALKARLLGPAEFELRLASLLNGAPKTLPEGATLLANGPDWVRYQVSRPTQVNPAVIQFFIANGHSIVSLQEVPRNLEQVYMQAISAPDEVEKFHAE
jgi:ABC-2 type transport system ATP-binding protein